jgi:hypothetical protein
MTTDVEADLRHEFDAAARPDGLHFSPEAILRQGSRSVRRRRIVAVGSASMAVAVMVAGAALLSRPHPTAAPQPAIHTTTTGTVQSSLGVNYGTSFQFELKRNTKVTSNLRLFAVKTPGAKRQQLGEWSIRPGQKPDAVWKSGMFDGHPFTVGLVPGKGVDVTLGNGNQYAVSWDNTNIPGYTMFAVEYQNFGGKEPTRPTEIARIVWAGPDGVVDGVEGNHRLTGRVFTMDRSVSVKVVLRPGKGGRTTVFGATQFQSPTESGYTTDLSVATTDASGAAVLTGFYATEHRVTKGKSQGLYVGPDGSPMAAGILPAGASDIGVDLSSGERMTGLAKTETLPDGRVIFALDAKLRKGVPNKDLIKAVTWTYADGSQGLATVNQKRPPPPVAR